MLKSFLIKILNTKIVKTYYKDDFLHEFDFELRKGVIYKYKDNHFDILTIIFEMVLDNMPLKRARKLGNHARTFNVKGNDDTIIKFEGHPSIVALKEQNEEIR